MIRRTLFTLALFAVAVSAFSQATDAPPLAAAVRSDQATAPELSGVIDRFLLNPNGHVDGLLLADCTQVNVPPDMSRTLTAFVRIGDVVHVVGNRVGAGNLVEARRITTTSGRTLVPDGMPTDRASSAPPPLQPMQASGRVNCVIYGPRAEVTGVLLDDGTSLRLPPPAADRISGLLVDGQRVSAQGFGVVTPLGRAIQVTTIGPDRASEQTVLSPPEPRASPRIDPSD